MDLYTIDNEEQLKVLRNPSVPVEKFDSDLEDFVQHMAKIMVDHQGIGLAAPQVGRNQRFFIVQMGDEPLRVFINPEIIETSQELSTMEEGCLSIPKSYSKVIRPERIKMQAWNLRGRPFTVEADGLLSHCLQHELDHLNGVLFIDHISQRKQEKITKKFNIGE